MEFKTCEEYVLNELEKTQNELELVTKQKDEYLARSLDLEHQLELERTDLTNLVNLIEQVRKDWDIEVVHSNDFGYEHRNLNFYNSYIASDYQRKEMFNRLIQLFQLKVLEK